MNQCTCTNGPRDGVESESSTVEKATKTVRCWRARRKGERVWQEEGIGKKYVSVLGLTAENGECDMTKLRISKEADRLLRKKVVHTMKPNEKGGDDPGAVKPLVGSTMVDKLKGKLHIGLKNRGTDKVI